MSKNNEAWNEIFTKYKILEKIGRSELFFIDANQIKEFREPRLMTKFDHQTSLPDMFKKNNLSILPITRWSYVIWNFQNYQNLELFTSKEVTIVSIPSHIESIDFNDIYSESTALNCAYVSWIIDDFLEEESFPTVSGRMSSSTFDFVIESGRNSQFKIAVQNSQCEIDWGFETLNNLALIEAKNHLANDFLIRQVYYPYRLWSWKISKPIKNIYMAFSNDIFHFYEYDFEEPKNYNSLKLVKYKAYRIAPEEIHLSEIIILLKNLNNNSTISKAPFPQADNFNRIIDLFWLLKANQELLKEDITSNYGFDKRQTDYYVNALIFLNLAIRSGNGIYSLSKVGVQISALPHKQKILAIIKCILENEVFHQVLSLHLEKLEPIEKIEIEHLLRKSKSMRYNSDSTILRRSQTVLKRVEWILEQVE